MWETPTENLQEKQDFRSMSFFSALSEMLQGQKQAIDQQLEILQNRKKATEEIPENKSP